MNRILLASTALLVYALPVAAQSTYASSRDTLRFSETRQFHMTLTTPQGDIPMEMAQRATIAVARLSGDSAHAWYDSLAISMSSPQGEQRPPTDSALKLPFRFGLDARGRVTNVNAPKWPGSLQGAIDPSHQFDDFFLRLPARPLTAGLAWSDTTVLTDSTGERYSHWVRTADYRVERDTMIGAEPALVISTTQKLGVNISGPVPGQQMRTDAHLDGDESGFFVFAPKTGRLIGRRLEGKLEGPVKASGAMGEVQMNQSIKYTGTMDAVK